MSGRLEAVGIYEARASAGATGGHHLCGAAVDVPPRHLLRHAPAVESPGDHGEPQRVSSASDDGDAALGLSRDDVTPDALGREQQHPRRPLRRLTASPQTTPTARSFVAATSAALQHICPSHARVGSTLAYLYWEAVFATAPRARGRAGWRWTGPTGRGMVRPPGTMREEHGRIHTDRPATAGAEPPLS